jgi:hypothetical protein
MFPGHFGVACCEKGGPKGLLGIEQARIEPGIRASPR